MVLSAISNGKTDIYTLNVRGQGRRMTNDEFDDLTPMFLNDSTIIYSTNYSEELDSLSGKFENLNQYGETYNIFMAEVRDTVRLTRLTNSFSKNVRPRKVNSNNVVFLSDQSGINNLMRLSVGNQVSSQISGFNKSIETFDVNSRMNKIAFAVRDGMESFLVVQSYSGADQFTPSTPRIQLEQAKSLNERLAARRRMESQTLPKREEEPLPKPTPQPEVQPLPQAIDTSSTKTTSSIDVDPLKFRNRNGIDTENYTFDSLSSTLLGQEREAESQDKATNLLEAFRKQSLKKPKSE